MASCNHIEDTTLAHGGARKRRRTSSLRHRRNASSCSNMSLDEPPRPGSDSSTWLSSLSSSGTVWKRKKCSASPIAPMSMPMASPTMDAPAYTRTVLSISSCTPPPPPRLCSSRWEYGTSARNGLPVVFLVTYMPKRRTTHMAHRMSLREKELGMLSFFLAHMSWWRQKCSRSTHCLVTTQARTQ